MFIARAVSSGMPGKWAFIDPMPAFDPSSKAYAAYIAIHGQDIYDWYTHLDFDTHRDKLMCPTVHHPRHDAESVYWILVVFLLKTIPIGLGNIPDTNFDEFCRAFARIKKHEVGVADDTRNLIWCFEWHKILHPGLKEMHQLLEDMTALITPEYMYVKNSLVEDHLHEAMQRRLLKQIVEMAESPIEIDANVVRHPKQVPGVPEDTDPYLESSWSLGTPQSIGSFGKKRRGTTNASDDAKRKCKPLLSYVRIFYNEYLTQAFLFNINPIKFLSRMTTL